MTGLYRGQNAKKNARKKSGITNRPKADTHRLSLMPRTAIDDVVIREDDYALEPYMIVVIAVLFVIGVAVITTSFFIVRRLHELHKVHNKIEGELFISEDGEMFAQYGIPIEEILERDYILLKVNRVNK